MPYTLKDALILDPRSRFFQKRVDVFIDKGKIRDISKDLKKKGKVIAEKGLCLSPGWIDMNVRINDPGYEFKESIAKTFELASKGGFTRLVTLPFTDPIIQSRDLILSLIEKGRSFGIHVHPLAALSQDFQDERLNDLQDLLTAGAVGFIDGRQKADPEMFANGLRYLNDREATIFSQTKDPELSRGAQVNEGLISTKLGMKGFSEEAETVHIRRDLDLLRMNGGRVHFPKLSTLEGLRLIKRAKSEGLKVSCDVPAYLFCLDESHLEGYATRYKLDPPLRSKKTIRGLSRFAEDGTIDAISSAHSPQDSESRDLEFDLASFGGRTLETCFPSFWTSTSQDLKKVKIAELFSLGPARILGLDMPIIEKDENAELTIFQNRFTWEYSGTRGHEYDDPFAGSEFHARLLGTINGLKSNL